MKRVMIYGGSGSGKSTLAREIGRITGLPVIHIDPMYYSAGWVQRSKTETHDLISDAMANDKWVFDGNHHKSMDERARRADTIIFLDLPTWLRVWRVLKRIYKYRGTTRPDMAAGCPERFDREFVFKWVMGYYWRSHKRDMAIFEGLPNSKQSLRLTSARHVRRYLNSLEQR